MKNIGAQLYTVRDLLKTEDQIRSTFAELKAIGYDCVQLYGSVAFAETCAKIAKETGLAVVGILSDLASCEKEEEALFRLCRAYQIRDIGISSNSQDCQNPEAYINRVNAFAKKVKRADFTFSYHNHGHEFIRLETGEIPMEIFVAGFSPNVDFMPDTYWLHDGGCDIRYFLERIGSRVKILHLKDLARIDKGHTFAEVGSGNLYFEGILKTALDCGIEEFVVEQDSCPGNPIESLRKSYNYIKKLIDEV